jgi:hypothetical protein
VGGAAAPDAPDEARTTARDLRFGSGPVTREAEEKRAGCIVIIFMFWIAN